MASSYAAAPGLSSATSDPVELVRGGNQFVEKDSGRCPRMSLATNAFKFTEQGYVEIVAHERRQARLEFAVRDSGRVSFR